MISAPFVQAKTLRAAASERGWGPGEQGANYYCNDGHFIENLL